MASDSFSDLPRADFVKVYRAVEEGRAVNERELAPAAARYAAWRRGRTGAMPAVRVGFLVLLVLVLVRAALALRDNSPGAAAIGFALAALLLACFAYGPLTAGSRLRRAEEANRALAAPSPGDGGPAGVEARRGGSSRRRAR